MAQQTSIQELQRAAILKMLNIGEDDQAMKTQTWKVLVYDKFCQEVIAPLLKVGGLRNHGVTLHLNLGSERLPVADTPAVYFVEPTTENIARIAKDLEQGLYPGCYINFASSVPRGLLEDLAKGACTANAAQKVAGVFDRYVSFVSLSASLYSLNLPSAYETINSPAIAEQMMMQYIERIVDGLLSVLITTRSLPVIRCPEGGAASMVARRLEERIRELLKSGAVAADLFSSASLSGGSLDGGATSRPLLCIVDRDVDLATMLNHTWTYQAMAHDVLGMKLNRLTVNVDSSGDAKAQNKSYDVDESDSFWTTHAGAPFPNVAEAVHVAIEQFEKKRLEMGQQQDDAAQGLDKTLMAAMGALPEMTEKKRSIDMHTNIATALLSEVKARELDMYYEMEDLFSSQSLSSSVSQLGEVLNDKERGTIVDKTRALMLLYLAKPSIAEKGQLDGLVDALQANSGDASGLHYLQHLASMNSFKAPSLVTTSSTNASGSSGASLMGNFGKAFGVGTGILEGAMTQFKNILPTKKDLVICQILDGLMEHKNTGVTENYIYLDPKAPPVPYGGEAPRIRAPFKKAIAFVIGGGNYAEMQALQEASKEHDRQVIYGSTDIVSPAQFVEELCHLGQELGGAKADLR